MGNKEKNGGFMDGQSYKAVVVQGKVNMDKKGGEKKDSIKKKS